MMTGKRKNLIPKRIEKPRTALALTALALAVGAASTGAAEPMSDTDISIAIEHEYLRDDFVPFNHVGVATEDGVVTLDGSVANLAARRHAEDIAGIVKGVRSVVNRIKVMPIERSRDRIAADVEDALASDPATETYGIDVEVGAGGAVTLAGHVDSWAQRQLAENVVTTVDGVTSLRNDIAVREAAAHRLEQEIAAEVEGRLAWDVRVDDSLIEVLVRDGGRVTLSGTVGSLAEKVEAERLAWVGGVQDVDVSHLDVERWARDDDLRRGKYAEKTDDQIRAAVSDALSFDPRIPETPMYVLADDGTVWLRGTVDSLPAKRAAQNDALNTVGVERVVNHLRVQPESVSDAVILETVIEGLRGGGLLDRDDIAVAVTDREVRLSGNVANMVDYWRADNIASTVNGVEALDNDLTVDGDTVVAAADWYGYYPRLAGAAASADSMLKSDRVLHEDVESELFWSPFVDEDDIQIDVDDGTVTLSGTVGSPQELRAARDNAFEAGALNVHSNLDIVQ